jgi:hypothetical protein
LQRRLVPGHRPALRVEEDTLGHRPVLVQAALGGQVQELPDRAVDQHDGAVRVAGDDPGAEALEQGGEELGVAARRLGLVDDVHGQPDPSAPPADASSGQFTRKVRF